MMELQDRKIGWGRSEHGLSVTNGIPITPVSALPGLSAAVGYGVAAVVANFVNKQAMQLLPLPNSVLLLQLGGSILLIVTLTSLGLVSLPPPSLARLQQLLPLAAAYGLHAALVLRSLATLNIPMYNTLKRMTPVLVLTFKACLDRKLPKLAITGSILLIVSGCVVAGLGDLAFDRHGYTLALACAAMQAAYIVLAERLGAAAEPFGPVEIIFYASVMCAPVAAVAAALTEGGRVAPQLLRLGEHWGPGRLAAWLAVVGTIECLLTGSLILCTQLNSALTTSIVGVLKGIVAVVLGFFFLGGAPFSLINALGITLNVMGGIWYSVIKHRQACEIGTTGKQG